MEEKIEFQRVRDIGEVIQASFNFIVQEFKGLFGTLLLYAGPFILLYIISNVFYQNDLIDYQSSMAQNATSFTNPFEIFGSLPLRTMLSSILFGWVSMVMVTIITFSYIKLYSTEGAGNFTKEDVWAHAKTQFLPYIGYSIVFSFIVSIGTMLLIIPGIYIGVSLSLIFVIKIVEGGGIGSVMDRSSKLIKDNWWATFGLYFVMWLMIFVFSLIYGLVYGIFGISKTLGGITSDLKTLSIIITSISVFINFLFYIFIFIGQSFQYFSLVEKKESPSLDERINRIQDNDY